MTIIDRDIAFYQGEVERLTDKIRRCRPRHESVYIDQRTDAQFVLSALRKYKSSIARSIRRDFIAATR